eukprot:3906766-Rhodomonas_salina.1
MCVACVARARVEADGDAVLERWWRRFCGRGTGQCGGARRTGRRSSASTPRGAAAAWQAGWTGGHVPAGPSAPSSWRRARRRGCWRTREASWGASGGMRTVASPSAAGPAPSPHAPPKRGEAVRGRRREQVSAARGGGERQDVSGAGPRR